MPEAGIILKSQMLCSKIMGVDPDGSSAEGTVDEELEAAEATDMVPEDGEADQDADSSTSDAAGQE